MDEEYVDLDWNEESSTTSFPKMVKRIEAPTLVTVEEPEMSQEVAGSGHGLDDDEDLVRNLKNDGDLLEGSGEIGRAHV